ncbi:hypothetical protein IVB45_12640 [Bradyrhizobium sp. 4]|uniref:hypothetical protein n=1 Tax=unclassified Bradyrhizobium TaxID=2631580 RepID=UPI001FF8E729|nr:MULTISPECIES: hypothetical protein [unclassified Bradyrhizobium]MCK1400730.1 hypothetical protein [Bradyrhizobium sp. 39]MCK1753463.1 hypothetical protein [Bradyrhizobium sp. 135]UPJ37628.1 hypothetical protein IVB45_12640 [Bradyrhizobium sp. 4]
MIDQFFTTIHLDAAHLVAGVLTAFYAGHRFATPRTLRSETTRFQYYSSYVTYIISCIGLLMFLSWTLAHKPELLGLLYSPSPIPEGLKSLDAPLVAALILTTLLPSVPVLRDIDGAMLRFFHRMGAIPLGAVRWAQRINMTQLTISERLVADTKFYIANSTLLPDSLAAQLQADFTLDSVRFRFTRCLALYVALSNLPGWTAYSADFPEERATFEKKMSSFFAQSVAFFTLTSQIAQRQLEPAAEPVDQFRSYALEAYEDIRLMLARVLLYSCNSDSEVAHQFARIGFSIQRPSLIRLPLNLLSLDFAGVVALFVIVTISLAGGDLGRALGIGMLVAVNQSIAAVCALAPKQLWNFADYRCVRERPTLSYLISGACTLTITLPISFCFYLLRAHFPVDAVHPVLPFVAQAKWLLLPTVLSIALAFACDDTIEADHEPWWLRWAESAGLAVLMGFSGFLVMHWLSVNQPTVQHLLLIPCLLSASIGALFGVTIPYWYRKTMRGGELEATKPVQSGAEKVAPAV